VNLQDLLMKGLASLGLSLPEERIGALLKYLELLQKWGAVYNLTAIKTPEEMLVQHILDCLSSVIPLQAKVCSCARVLDVGAGAGLPSVVLAIACPTLQVVAIDAVAKKTAFVQQVSLQLGISNLMAQHGRIEAIKTGDFDLIVSRAYSSLLDFVRGSVGAMSPGGLWMAMKGRIPTEEMQAVKELALVISAEELEVPGLSAQRCLIWMRPRCFT
jgi:16S rRNA (guanine527-N7)-methyltransferase